MLKNVEHVVLVILIIIVVVLVKYQNNDIETKNYYDDYRKLELRCDSIKLNNESIIDSLCQEIGRKESLIDSLFIVGHKIELKNEKEKEEILNLPLNESLELLRKNLQNYYE